MLVRVRETFADEGDVDRQGDRNLIHLRNRNQFSEMFFRFESKILGNFAIDPFLSEQNGLDLA